VGAVADGLDTVDDLGSAVDLSMRYRVSRKVPVGFALDGSISEEADSLLYISIGQRF